MFNTANVSNSEHITCDDTGIYIADDDTFRAFVNESPKSHSAARAKTQVDLVLPDVRAFSKPGKSFLFSCLVIN